MRRLQQQAVSQTSGGPYRRIPRRLQ